LPKYRLNLKMVCSGLPTCLQDDRLSIIQQKMVFLSTNTNCCIFIKRM